MKENKAKFLIVIMIIIIFEIFTGITNANNKTFVIDNVYSFFSLKYADSNFDIARIEKNKINLIKFYYRDKDDNLFKNIINLKAKIKEEGYNLIFATNGGIFSKKYAPLGLYFEAGKQLFELNKKDGYGNFYLKPNGIFLIEGGEAKIEETTKIVELSNIKYALQSGPLLVFKGRINSLFKKNSINKYIRSGVGINVRGDICFAISNEPVNFYSFAMLFKEMLNCDNALYLDGAISEMYIPKFRENSENNFSVIIGIVGN